MKLRLDFIAGGSAAPFSSNRSTPIRFNDARNKYIPKRYTLLFSMAYLVASLAGALEHWE
jgi:hypothetical protein